MAGTTRTRSTSSRSATAKASRPAGRTTSSRASSGASRSASRKAGNGNMAESRFQHLFMEELKDIYWAEKNLVKALPKMQKAATSEELASAISEHLNLTKEHVMRLEQVFDMMGKKASGKKCEAMEGLIAEGQQVISDTEEDSMVRDAGLIIAAQKIEHYEIAAYGSLRTLAHRMGNDEVASILEQTLEEEKEADSLLTDIAESSINEEASEE